MRTREWRPMYVVNPYVDGSKQTAHLHRVEKCGRAIDADFQPVSRAVAKPHTDAYAVSMFPYPG